MVKKAILCLNIKCLLSQRFRSNGLSFLGAAKGIWGAGTTGADYPFHRNFDLTYHYHPEMLLRESWVHPNPKAPLNPPAMQVLNLCQIQLSWHLCHPCPQSLLCPTRSRATAWPLEMLSTCPLVSSREWQFTEELPCKGLVGPFLFCELLD